jgi:type I restriction enzyme R subunit
VNHIGQRERVTQDRVVAHFQQVLGYRYLGNLHDADNRNIREADLTAWLTQRGVADALIGRALRQFDIAAALGEGKTLYDANKAVYQLLRYGIKDKAGAGEQNQTVWLIDWKHPEANDFAIAEEVSVKGENKKRPDIVLYVNGIALAVLELKRSSVSIGEGIRQNLDNQKKEFIRNFFTSMQLVMAGNDSQGLRYGTIETPEKHYLEWKEADDTAGELNKLDHHLSQVCRKDRLLELIHDFIVFDAGIKKTCRHNQYFGIQSAKQFIARREGGIIWHTQGSGKSLTMVWLAKWIRENIHDARVLLVTDRTELDEQIEKVFTGVEEQIVRTNSGADLITKLNATTPWLLCSLVHKFGRGGEDEDDSQSADDFIQEMKRQLPTDFHAKGNLFVFVDECHRTQSGRLHAAMKSILPEALFIGFTGTPLLKKDKQKSIEVFGRYIHTYKFDEAVNDGVVLDLRYEARDIDQQVTSQKKVDDWFEAKTRGLSNLAKMQIKQKWGTLQKVLSSKSRLVCSSVYQACKSYDLFAQHGFADKCAIVTSYQPNATSIKGEETGEGLTEKLFKYDTYRKMLANYFGKSEEEAAKLVEAFEIDVKKKFIKEPGQMRLLIVVDKLLTGFDAPSATYLYIDKPMADHNLFQAICRVNRLDGDDKEYGYIVDYKDLFRSLDKAISDYTSEAFADYDQDDVAGLLKDRLTEARKDLTEALEQVRSLCEPVKAPRAQADYFAYFCGVTGEAFDTSEKEALRLTFYQLTAKLLRAYANIANEMSQAGYNAQQITAIREEVAHYEKVRDEVKLNSGDLVDMKRFEPAMRQLLDMYIRADDSEQLMDFEDLGLLEIIVQKGVGELAKGLPSDIANNQQAMAETIENNVRRKIVDENPVNPRYYEQMSVLLNELIEQRRQQALDYQEYLIKIRDLAKQVLQPASANDGRYPTSLDTQAKRALYDNLDNDEGLALKLDTTVKQTKQADWYGDRMKERQLANAVREELASYNAQHDIADVMNLIKAQQEYR